MNSAPRHLLLAGGSLVAALAVAASILVTGVVAPESDMRPPCARAGAEFGDALDQRILEILDTVEPRDWQGAPSLISFAEARLAARAIAELRDDGRSAECDADEFLTAAEGKFSDELRAGVGPALRLLDEERDDVSYAEWLANLREMLAAMDPDPAPPPDGAAVQTCENPESAPPYRLSYPAGWFVHPPAAEQDVAPCQFFGPEPFEYAVPSNPDTEAPWSVSVNVLHGCYSYEGPPVRARSALVDGFPAAMEDTGFYYHWRIELLDVADCDRDVTASVYTNQRGHGDFEANKAAVDLMAGSIDFITDPESAQP